MARCFRELIPEDRFSLLQTYLWKSFDNPTYNIVF
jgi:hypothetical protein